MYLNKVFIFGNLTRDPELRSLPSGNAVASFGVATNRVWKDQQGNKQEGTEFHNVVVFGKQAEIVSQYLKKGSSVLVEGRIQTRSWDGQDGVKKYKTEIVAERIQFGPRTGGGFNGASQGGGNSGKGSPAKSAEMPSIEYPEEDIKPEDIPF
ncbi:MAG: single-stranded DNA-binding protein [Candidatus Lloydbacteria bacterium]|nr:single-stranded DNA-binding protein [Candidatus Lloydbacteria bacterium]